MSAAITSSGIRCTGAKKGYDTTLPTSSMLCSYTYGRVLTRLDSGNLLCTTRTWMPILLEDPPPKQQFS
jgi:hypothetical protein